MDIDDLVGRSGGATQAFLKDWVHRAVQIATERIRPESDKLELRAEDFDTAIRETRVAGGDTSGRIIGFLGES